MRAEPLLLSGDLRGCEDDAGCERHRALGGHLQHTLVKCVTSAALTLMVGGGASLSWRTHAEDVSTTRAHISAPLDYLHAFVSSAPGAGDPVSEQMPEYRDWQEKGTWTLLVHGSGRLEVIGDQKRMLAEFWRLNFMAPCWDGAEWRIPDIGNASIWMEWQYPKYYVSTIIRGGDNRIVSYESIFTDAPTWRVRLFGDGRVIVAGTIPPESIAVWKSLAATAPHC
jgi:hypothetical protein